MFGEPRFGLFRKGVSSPPRGGNVGRKDIRGGGLRGQGCGGSQ